MSKYRTMTDVMAVDNFAIVEKIGHCIGFTPEDEERILPSRHPQSKTIFSGVEVEDFFEPDFFEPDLDEMDGPSVSDLLKIVRKETGRQDGF